MKFRSFLRPVAALAALSGLAAYATIMLRGPQGLEALAEKHKEIRQLQEENDRKAHEIEKERDFIERLKHDPSTQEMELEREGYLHKNDTLFKETDKSIQLGVGESPAPQAPKPASSDGSK